jgi:hypothetical protein
LKRLLFFSILFLFAANLNAQSNFYKWSAGVNVGGTLLYGDSDKKRIGYAYAGVVDYYFTPYMNLGFEFQAGKLKGGEIGVRSFENNYKTIAFNGRMQLGQFLNDNHLDSFIWRNLKGFYVGAGLGAIDNKVDITLPHTVGYFKNKEIFMPVNVGLNINIQRKWQEYSRMMVNINYQTVVSFEDGMDGDYDLKSNSNDRYSFLSLGLRYNFGSIGLDQSKRRL